MVTAFQFAEPVDLRSKAPRAFRFFLQDHVQPQRITNLLTSGLFPNRFASDRIEEMQG
jgi:hypothetical protein